MTQNQTNVSETKTTFRTVPVLGITLLVLVAFSVLLYASWSSVPSIPQVEVDSHFNLADKNKDGVVTKEEFRGYLETLRLAATDENAYVRHVSSEGRIGPTGGCRGGGGCGGCGQAAVAATVKICPSTGAPCASGGAGCCGGGCGGCGETKAVSNIKICPNTGAPCASGSAGCCGGCDGCGDTTPQGGCCQVDGGECDGRCGE